MVGIGSHDKALPQQRGEIIAIEMDAADQVVASAILYEPRLSHAMQCITKSITASTALCQCSDPFTASFINIPTNYTTKAVCAHYLKM